MGLALFGVLLPAILSIRQGKDEDCNLQSRLLHTFPASYVQLSPDNRQLAGVTNDNSAAVIWDVESGELKHQFHVLPSAAVYDVAWSPDGSRLLLAGERTFVVTATFLLLLNLSIASWKGAWSPCGDMFVIARVGCQVLNATTGDLIASWGRSLIADKTLSWNPGPLIAIRGDVYSPNGTLVFQSRSTRAVWGENNTLAEAALGNLTLSDSRGVVLQSATIPRIVNGVVWSQDGTFLATCYDRCLIWDRISLTVILDFLPPGGRMIARSFSSEGSLLVLQPEHDAMTISVWNTQTSLVRTFPRPSVSTNDNDQFWTDRDSFVICGNVHDGSYQSTRCEQINTRTMGTKGYLTHGVSASCVMKSELFLLYWNRTVQVWEEGRFITQWEVSNKDVQIFCAHQDLIATASESTMSIWDKRGSPVANVFVDPRGSLMQAAVLDKDVVAYYAKDVDTDRGYLYLYPNTSRVRKIEITFKGPHPFYPNSLRWSLDGSWLAIVAPLCFWSIYDAQGNMVATGPEDGHLDWVSDALLISTSTHFLLVDPERDITLRFVEELCPFGGRWNPFTVEVACVNGDNVLLLKPVLPSLQGLSVHNNTVGATATFQVTARIALLPSLHQAMIRWIDTSTSSALCLFVHVQNVSGATVTLESVVLQQPGLYTAYLPGLPWVGSDPFSVMVSCPDPALPLINVADGLTSCTCPGYMHATNSNPLAPIQCSLCPTHGVCDGTSQVISQKGFWSTSKTHFIPCAAGVCNGNNSCHNDYYGPLCGLCVSGTGQHGFGRCQRCSHAANIIFLVFGFLCWAAFCALQSLFALGWRNSLHRGNHSIQLAGILVSTAQANALLLSLNIDLGAMYDSVGYVEEVSQTGVSSAAVSCLLQDVGFHPGTVHYIKQVIVLSLPFLAWIILHGVRGILRLVCRVDSTIDVVRVPIVVVWASTQPVIYTSVLQTFNCVNIDPSDVSHLRHDLSAVCYNKTYWWFLSLVTIPAVLAIVIMPIWIYYLLRFRPTASDSGHLRFLVKSYREDWWFLVIVARKVILSALVTWTRNPFYVAFCLALACTLQIVVSPSTSRIVNVAEAVSLLSSTFIFAVAGSLHLDDALETYRGGAYFLLVVAGISYLLQCSLLIYDRIWSAKQGKNHVDEPLYMLLDS